MMIIADTMCSQCQLHHQNYVGPKASSHVRTRSTTLGKGTYSATVCSTFLPTTAYTHFAFHGRQERLYVAFHGKQERLYVAKADWVSKLISSHTQLYAL